MKKVMALTAGFLVAFAPAGTAFAGEPGGNAWGNCGNSASGGRQQLEDVAYRNGSALGGLSGFSKSTKGLCELPASEDPSGGLGVETGGGGSGGTTPVKWN